jgi:hypothetical protein
MDALAAACARWIRRELAGFTAACRYIVFGAVRNR